MLTNRSIPNCSVIPELPYADIGQAIKWLGGAFGFTLRLRIADHRAQLNVGDGAVVLVQSEGVGPATACRVLVRVEDVDQHHQKSSRHGARILRSPTSYAFGERQYSVEDFAGHCWTFSQSIADVAPEDWGGTPGQL